MTDPIRKQIIDGLKTILEGITEANGYNTTVDTVEVTARHYADDFVHVNKPWIGIIPQKSNREDYPGHSYVTWPIELIVHDDSATRYDALHLRCTEIDDDLHKALYTYSDLGGIDNVVDVKIKGIIDTLGSRESVDEGIASVAATIEIRFWKDNP